jgi:hypothetical protein
MRKNDRKMALLFGATALITLPAFGDLNLSDPSIINLYRFNEQSSGQLDNSVLGSFVDTAPTGSAQNHDDFADGASDGPAWTTGAAYNSPSGVVGDGVGLAFTRADSDRTRYSPWMNQTQGNYSNGKSFSLMMRIKPGELLDNTAYNLTGIGSHGITLNGVSGGGQGAVSVRLRDDTSGTSETYWSFDSLGTGDPNSTGAAFKVYTDTWANIFVIYDANARLTIALDDGTNFYTQTSTVPPAGFDTLNTGYSDFDRHWWVGSNTSAEGGGYDGLIESIVFWDKALSNAEADAIGLLNAAPTWNVNASGDWNVASNWGTGEVPNAVGAVARFYGAITSNKTVYSDSAVTVGQLLINNANTYVIGGAGTLTMQNVGTDAALIDVAAGTQKISIPLVIASDTTLNVASGATLKISNPMTINAGKNVTQTGSGAVLYESIVTVQAAASIGFVNATHANSLVLQSTASASVATHTGGNPTTLQLDNLTMDADSTLDLKNNRLLVKSSAATIRSTIKAGDIKSTLATSQQNLGYIDQGGGNVEVLYTLLGDADLNLQVNSVDFNAFVAGYGATANGAWANGDFNYDDKINTLDFNALAGNFGATLSAPALGSVVPEPGSILAITAIAIPAIMRRRRA